ncbi:MAG: ATPase, partial [Oscillospiraceae bacterium]|nr:ATPase [Oscillospiraceae bacterium]
MKYIKQQIEKQVLELGKAWSAILLTGPGQVEKITMLWGLVKREDNGRKYVSLDDLNTQEVAKSDLNKFLKIHKPSV